MLDELETEVAPEVREARGPAWLLCAACGARIAERGAATSFDGGHRHRFVNPHGLAFTIALFDGAPGCAAEGEATEHFSWFPGYAWRVAVCRGCRTHLGWAFECVGPPGVGEPGGFHGLIEGRLRG